MAADVLTRCSCLPIFWLLKRCSGLQSRKRGQGLDVSSGFAVTSLCKSSSLPAYQNHLRHEVTSRQGDCPRVHCPGHWGRLQLVTEENILERLTLSCNSSSTDGQKKVTCPAGTYFFLFSNPSTPPQVHLSGTSGLVSSGASPHISSFPWAGGGGGGLPQHTVGVSAPTIVSSLSQKAMHQSFCELTAFICVKFQSFSLHGVFDCEYLSGMSLRPALPVL